MDEYEIYKLLLLLLLLLHVCYVLLNTEECEYANSPLLRRAITPTHYGGELRRLRKLPAYPGNSHTWRRTSPSQWYR